MANESYNAEGFFPEDCDKAHLGYYSAAASQTWKRGDLLDLSSGTVIIASSSSTASIGAAADDRTSTSAGDQVPVYDDPDQVYIGIADADPSGLTIGDQVDLVGATGAQLVDVGASSTNLLTYLGTLPTETSDAQYAKVRVRITGAQHGAQ